jgi:hypothetical protein
MVGDARTRLTEDEKNGSVREHRNCEGIYGSYVALELSGSQAQALVQSSRMTSSRFTRTRFAGMHFRRYVPTQHSIRPPGDDYSVLIAEDKLWVSFRGI